MGPGFEPCHIGVENVGGERFENQVFVIVGNRSSAPNKLCEKRGD